MDAAATPSTLETILANLTERDREQVSMRMIELQKAANDATDGRNKAEAARKQLETTEATEQDYKVLDNVLGEVMSKIDTSMYNINPAMYNYESRNEPERLKVRNLETILCACNTALSQINNNNSIAADVGTKRKRAAAADDDEHSRTNNVMAGSSSEALLAQALEAKFSAGAKSHQPWA